MKEFREVFDLDACTAMDPWERLALAANLGARPPRERLIFLRGYSYAFRELPSWRAEATAVAVLAGFDEIAVAVGTDMPPILDFHPAIRVGEHHVRGVWQVVSPRVLLLRLVAAAGAAINVRGTAFVATSCVPSCVPSSSRPTNWAAPRREFAVFFREATTAELVVADLAAQEGVP